MTFTEILMNEAKDSNTFIKYMIKDMQKEFDTYIREMKADIPWWYNERALLGFFISGLLRNKSNFVLQEYSCYKGKKSAKPGRADLLFQYDGNKYLTEAKICWTFINTKSDLTDAQKWANNVLIQANKYAYNENDIQKKKVFSLCFEVIYCGKASFGNYTDLIKDWIDKRALHYLDFYSLIQLKTTILQNSKFENYYYPALATYGLFNK